MLNAEEIPILNSRLGEMEALLENKQKVYQIAHVWYVSGLIDCL